MLPALPGGAPPSPRGRRDRGDDPRGPGNPRRGGAATPRRLPPDRAEQRRGLRRLARAAARPLRASRSSPALPGAPRLGAARRRPEPDRDRPRAEHGLRHRDAPDHPGLPGDAGRDPSRRVLRRLRLRLGGALDRRRTSSAGPRSSRSTSTRRASRRPATTRRATASRSTSAGSTSPPSRRRRRTRSSPTSRPRPGRAGRAPRTAPDLVIASGFKPDERGGGVGLGRARPADRRRGPANEWSVLVMRR